MNGALTSAIQWLDIGTHLLLLSANIQFWGFMDSKTGLQKLTPLLKGRNFNSKEARTLGVSSALLSYYVSRDKLIRLGHGVYRGVNVTAVEDFRWEDLIDAAARVKNGVICLVSALALYQLTDEIPRQHWIAISNTTRHRSDARVRIIRVRNLELGRTNFKIDHIKLAVFDRERTLVDAFKYLGTETALKALRLAVSKKRAEKVSFEKLRLYAKKLRVKIEPYLLAVST